jgi:hypothetical protein
LHLFTALGQLFKAVTEEGKGAPTDSKNG